MTEAQSAKPRVLVVEDEAELVEMHRKLLGSYLPEDAITVAQNAADAMRALKASPPSAIVLDLMMPYGATQEALNPADDLLNSASDPDMVDTGISLLKWIRQEPWGSGLWIAVVTARSDATALKQVDRALGERGWIFRKPFSTLLLEAMLCDVLGLECKLPPNRVKRLLDAAGWRRP